MLMTVIPWVSLILASLGSGFFWVMMCREMLSVLGVHSGQHQGTTVRCLYYFLLGMFGAMMAYINADILFGG